MDGVQLMFSVDADLRPPWHGKGPVFREGLTSREALREAGQLFTVEKAQATAGGVEIPGWYATRRKDTGQILGLVGSGYHVVQNESAFSFFDTIISRGEACFITGGTLLEGQRVWLLAKLPGVIMPVAGDSIERYVLFVNDHGGQLKVTVRFTPVRVVCWNTLSFALAGMDNLPIVKIKHTSKAEEQLKQAHKVLGIVARRSVVLENMLREFAEFKISSSMAKGIIQRVFPSQSERVGRSPGEATVEIRDVITQYAYGAVVDCQPSGTAYSLYMAITRAVDHQWKSKKGTDDLNRNWLGTGAQRKVSAFKLIRQLIREGEDALPRYLPDLEALPDLDMDAVEDDNPEDLSFAMLPGGVGQDGFFKEQANDDAGAIS